jgi:hypothetical protein
MHIQFRSVAITLLYYSNIAQHFLHTVSPNLAVIDSSRPETRPYIWISLFKELRQHTNHQSYAWRVMSASANLVLFFAPTIVLQYLRILHCLKKQRHVIHSVHSSSPTAESHRREFYSTIYWQVSMSQYISYSQPKEDKAGRAAAGGGKSQVSFLEPRSTAWEDQCPDWDRIPMKTRQAK